MDYQEFREKNPIMIKANESEHREQKRATINTEKIDKDE